MKEFAVLLHRLSMTQTLSSLIFLNFVILSRCGAQPCMTPAKLVLRVQVGHGKNERHSCLFLFSCSAGFT